MVILSLGRLTLSLILAKRPRSDNQDWRDLPVSLACPQDVLQCEMDWAPQSVQSDLRVDSVGTGHKLDAEEREQERLDVC